MKNWIAKCLFVLCASALFFFKAPTCYSQELIYPYEGREVEDAFLQLLNAERYLRGYDEVVNSPSLEINLHVACGSTDLMPAVFALGSIDAAVDYQESTWYRNRGKTLVAKGFTLFIAGVNGKPKAEWMAKWFYDYYQHSPELVEAYPLLTVRDLALSIHSWRRPQNLSDGRVTESYYLHALSFVVKP